MTEKNSDLCLYNFYSFKISHRISLIEGVYSLELQRVCPIKKRKIIVLKEICLFLEEKELQIQSI